MTENSSTATTKGGRTKSPLSFSKSKPIGDLQQKSWEELQAVSAAIASKPHSIADLLGFMAKSEVNTQAIFAASKLRFLQRGMLLTELKEAVSLDESERRPWYRFFEEEVQPVVLVSEKTAEVCCTVWNRWLTANDLDGASPEALLTDGGSIHDFNKSLKNLLEVDIEPAVKSKPSAHERVRKIRKQLSQGIAAHKVGMPSDDATYEAMVKSITDKLLELEDYIATMPAHQEVVDVTPVAPQPQEADRVQLTFAV